MGSLRRFISRVLATFRAGRADREASREIAAHLRLLEDDLLARGLTPEQARQQARRSFGGVVQATEHHRDARAFGAFAAWWVDLKLGFRMLAKYPGLTLVGVLGMAAAAAIAAVSFAILYGSLHPTLPLPEGERIVGLENFDRRWNNQEDRNLHDLATWRAELRSVRDLSAFEMIQRNLIGPDGHPEALSVARMTASGFRIAAIPPLHGRPLVEDDERPSALSVAVIGYDVWRRHFGSDPAAIGRRLRLGRTEHTVVGVMPDGFKFPINHQVWVPLETDPAPYARRRGPAITIFGRLTPGATTEDAAAELTAIGARAAAAFPDTHGTLRPRIVRYTELWFDDGPRAEMHALQALVSMLLVAIGVNVAILVYARTATRQGEIALRTALGGSRQRIVAQLFIEALVLSGVAAALGLVVAAYALREARQAADLLGVLVGGLPFWMTFELSTGTVAYTALLAVAGGAIVGIPPALQATGRRLRTGLQGVTGRGGSGMRLGGTWTTLIVLQVAFAVALLPAATTMAWQSIRAQIARADGIAAEFLVTRVAMDRDAGSTESAEADAREYTRRYSERVTELVRRIEAEPAVSAVTLASPEPGNEAEVAVAVGPMGGGASATTRARIARVGLDFFETFDITLLSGRTLTAADRDPAARTVVVNRTFAEYLEAGGVLGRRIGLTVELGSEETGSRPETREYEVVGVVSDFPETPVIPGEVEPRLYYPLAADDLSPRIAIRVRGIQPSEFAGRVREIAASLDPTLRLAATSPLTDVVSEDRVALQWGAIALSVVTLSVVLLSAAGIHALMSFSVTRRRREIGIRVALGADARQVRRSVFSRVIAQLGSGVALGLAMALLIDVAAGGGLVGGYGLAILPAVAVLMILVGLAAAAGPARRIKQINPTEALRAE